ncbi:RHS repeat-associated core domain-containing protein [Lampropedia aestuarii]|uniref:RHS repeat-associated core domain-containing protein n=1 Tax=Lampropedia aestuarii TaxID=2562762 RepID=UPI002468E87F|nr:RHS repeat-associated core domain-containing protein [Lampropedia aestuarii]MDH5856535.1 RHS repeat-associated core domain-containing protein [Lampropedia aestuarii]
MDAQRQKEAVFAEAKRQLTADGKWLELEDTNPLQIRYYHCNQIGTPLALSDAQGQIVWAAQYDPWGNVQREYNADPEHIRQDIRLPGQHHDRSTGLYYNRYRFYDPQLGAYVNQDPIGLRGGINTYGYAHDPIKIIDPTGLANSGAAPKMIKKMLETYSKQDNYGDTSACSYYAEVMQSNPNCNYYKAGLGICSGENSLVNVVVNFGYLHAKALNNTSASFGETLEKIRASLIISDMEARSNGDVDENGCVRGNIIDDYHDKAFSEAGINTMFYGGNLWPQAVWPNPVPLDPSTSKYSIKWLWNK